MAADFMTTDLLEQARLIFDTAALVLIWLVQLVIYPVFMRMTRANFQAWHPVYTQRVTLVVFPTMLGQLATTGLLLLHAPDWTVWTNAILIALAWAVTFLLAVPIHTKIEQVENHLSLAKRLLKINWGRTVLWTLVWLITLVANYR